MNPDIIHFHLKLLTDVYSLVLLLPLQSQGLQPSPPQLGKIWVFQYYYNTTTNSQALTQATKDHPHRRREETGHQPTHKYWS